MGCWAICALVFETQANRLNDGPDMGHSVTITAPMPSFEEVASELGITGRRPNKPARLGRQVTTTTATASASQRTLSAKGPPAKRATRKRARSSRLNRSTSF